MTNALEATPETPLQWQPDVEFARAIFIKASEQTQNKQDISFEPVELNHIANSILNRYISSATRITLEDDNTATVFSTLKLSKNLAGYYLNIHFKLQNQFKGLAVSDLRIGNLTIDQHITNFLLNYILKHSFLKQYYLLGQQHIQAIQIKNHQLLASYALNANATGFANANTVDPESLAFYQQQVDLITARHDPKWRLSLAELLQPLFKQAYSRTTLKNAIAENIAIIYAVSAYVNQNDVPFYVSLKQPLTTQHQYPVYLYKRNDQAKHFMLSAVLTTSGGARLADIMGQEKELRDVQTKSGFSFIDLAADRAGMKFSEQAIRSPENAKDLQRIMADIKDYSAFMPDVQDLPEKLTNAQFSQRFDAIGSEAYRELLQKIDDRIEALPIYPKH